jgi:hypothetical protein
MLEALLERYHKETSPLPEKIIWLALPYNAAETTVTISIAF